MKKYYLFMLILTLSCFGTVAQTEQKNTTKAGEEEVFVVVEENPEFPNGMEGLYQFLATNMNYPADAKAKGIEGKVYVTFVVEKDGSVNNIKTIRSPHPMLTEEAERVVKAMPKWKAGKQHGKKVRVQYTLPINFQLDPK